MPIKVVIFLKAINKQRLFEELSLTEVCMNPFLADGRTNDHSVNVLKNKKKHTVTGTNLKAENRF